MPSRITVRYFQVILPPHATRPFSEALRDVSEIEQLDDRKKVVDGTGFRLEHYDEHRGLQVAELTRIQDDNLPAQVLPHGLAALDAEELGYGSAFVFDPALSVLAMQYNPRLVTPGRLGQYLREHDPRNKFGFLPIPGPDAMDTFADGGLKSFKVKIASPVNYALNADNQLSNSIEAMARAYESPYVTVTFGVGHRKAVLGEELKDAAMALLGRAPVASMKAKIVESPDEIDLMSAMLHTRDSIRIPADPQESYRVRSNFVERSFAGHHEYIAQYVGAD